MDALRKFALSYPDAREGIACKGTTLEKRTITAGGKAFLFIGAADLMLKLRDSLAEAADVVRQAPAHGKVGANGWVTITLAGIDATPVEMLKRWVDESYRLLAPKRLVAALDASPRDLAPTTTRMKRSTKKQPRPSKKAARARGA